jgi:hypothetical protein
MVDRELIQFPLSVHRNLYKEHKMDLLLQFNLPTNVIKTLHTETITQRNSENKKIFVTEIRHNKIKKSNHNYKITMYTTTEIN